MILVLLYKLLRRLNHMYNWNKCFKVFISNDSYTSIMEYTMLWLSMSITNLHKGCLSIAVNSDRHHISVGLLQWQQNIDCNNQASTVKHYQRQLCLIIQLFTIINMHRSKAVKRIRGIDHLSICIARLSRFKN